MQKQNLLVEIGTEELPPDGLCELGEAFATSLKEACDAAGFGSDKAHAFATPRRIAARLDALHETQADRTLQRKGPLVEKAYDKDGNPLPPAIGFAESCGVSVAELRILADEQRLYVQKTVKGQSITDCISTLLARTLENLPLSKRMRWGDTHYEFIRPVHWVLALYGDTPLTLEVMGITAGIHTYGHRYHCRTPIVVPHADHYEEILQQQGKVIPAFAKRLQQLSAKVKAAAQSGDVQMNDDLLVQVTSIVEWPIAVRGHFDSDFLKLPAAVITKILEKEQKCFTVLSADGSLAAEFIAVANIDSSDPQALCHGYERVVAPRLKDAVFFIDQDRKHPLKHYANNLDTLVFHQRLGSLAAKVERVVNISRAIAQHLSPLDSRYHFEPDDLALVEKSARLCKADLRTGIVCEYPELAGFIGGYYAQCDGEPTAVCSAIRQHIKPLRTGDSLPEEKIAVVLAIADRLDTLVGIFGVGEYPSGSRDPYALRRASSALIRIATEYQLDLDLSAWLVESRQSYAVNIPEEGIERLLDYLQERLKYYFVDCGFSSDRIKAVSVDRPLHCYDIHCRLLQLQSFMQMPQSSELTAATKRIRNILKNNLSENIKKINRPTLNNDVELNLYEVFTAQSPHVQKLIHRGNYLEALKALALLKDPIDHFFAEVLVMSENETEKNNRLALLYQIDSLFMQIANFSELRAAE